MKKFILTFIIGGLLCTGCSLIGNNNSNVPIPSKENSLGLIEPEYSPFKQPATWLAERKEIAIASKKELTKIQDFASKDKDKTSNINSLITGIQTCIFSIENDNNGPFCAYYAANWTSEILKDVELPHELKSSLQKHLEELSKKSYSYIKEDENIVEDKDIINHLVDDSNFIASQLMCLSKVFVNNKITPTTEVKEFTLTAYNLTCSTYVGHPLTILDSLDELRTTTDKIIKQNSNISKTDPKIFNIYIISEKLNSIKKYSREYLEKLLKSDKSIEIDFPTIENPTPTDDKTVAQQGNGEKATDDKTIAQQGNDGKATDDKTVAQQEKDGKNLAKTKTDSQKVKPSLKITIIKQGTGKKCQKGDIVKVHYTGKFADGTTFDSSYDRNSPLEFPLGKDYVIEGWEKGISGMKVGEKRSLVIPPDLAYGEEGNGPVPPNSTLYFDVELVDIK